MKVLEVWQGMGPSPHQLSLGEKHKRDSIYKPERFLLEREINPGERPPWSYVWYVEDKEGYLSIYKQNIDSSG